MHLLGVAISGKYSELHIKKHKEMSRAYSQNNQCIPIGEDFRTMNPRTRYLRIRVSFCFEICCVQNLGILNSPLSYRANVLL